MTGETLLLIAIGLAVLVAVVLLVVRGRKPDTKAPAPAAPPPPAELPSPFLSAPDGPPDDLRAIKGIGPKLEAMLRDLGVFHYRQIAAWTPEQLALVDSQLGAFAGRPERDQWQEQARLLAAGDLKAYERAHGKLGTLGTRPAADGGTSA